MSSAAKTGSTSSWITVRNQFVLNKFARFQIRIISEPGKDQFCSLCVQACREKQDLLGFFYVGGGLDEVSLLFIEQTQLVQREGDQVMIVSDPTLTA